MPVGVVHLTERMEALSSAVLNGGDSAVSAVFIMQVSKNYDHPDPAAHADAVRRELGLPEDSLGMMTAAEVRHVFNVREVEFEGMEVTAIATAGLSNHVVAGEVLDDYDEKSAVSAMRAKALAGTINICVVSPVPLSTAGKVNLMIPLVEGKSVAMAEHGFLETGTTSDRLEHRHRRRPRGLRRGRIRAGCARRASYADDCIEAPGQDGAGCRRSARHVRFGRGSGGVPPFAGGNRFVAGGVRRRGHGLVLRPEGGFARGGRRSPRTRHYHGGRRRRHRRVPVIRGRPAGQVRPHAIGKG